MSRRSQAAPFALALLLFASGAGAACKPTDTSEALLAEAQRAQKAGKVEDAIACRVTLAKLHEQNGKLPESVALLKATLPQMEQFSGATSEPTADLLRQLGWVEYQTGAVADADAHLRRAHAIYLSRLGPRHIKVSKALNNLGVVARDRGQYEEAESLFANALDVATRGLTPDDDMRAVIHNNLAGVWYYRGDYRRAVEQYKTALPIFERLYGEINSDVGITVNNLGAMSEELGDYAAASAYYTRALAIQEKLLGPTHPTVAPPVSNLAVLAHSLGDTPRAEQLFQRALQIYEAALGRDHPTIAETLVKYAALKHDLGQDEIARDFLERALKNQEAAYGADSNWTAMALNELGPVYQALGQSERAKDAMVQSIGVAAATDEQQILLDAYGSYADVLAANGELAAAAFYGKFAVNLAQQMRNDVSALGRAVQKSFLAKRQHYYRDLADRLIALGRLAEAEQVMTMLKEEEYFDFVRVALRTADGGTTRASFASFERAHADDFDRTLQRLAAAAREFRTAEGDAKATRRTVLTREQDATRNGLTSISRTLSRSATASPTAAVAPRPREDVPPGTAVVRYLVTPKRVRMIVATARETIDTQVEISEPQLNRLVFELRQAVQDPRSNALPAATALYRLLIAPLEPALARNQIRSFAFEPDGALRYVPFATLYDGKSYLIERYDLEQRTLADARRGPAGAAGSRRLAGFGVSRAMGGFPALPSVGTELDRIVRRGPEDRDGVIPGILLMDDAFTEASLRDTLAKDYSLVHVASHFVFRPGPLSDSYLLLGSGEPLTLERLRDGQLSLANVQLLTLSACSTAMGESAGNGGELESFGVLAQRLGAREVLATLWPVADRSTSVLMLNLYRASDSAKLPTARALQRAQLTLLRGDPRFAPYAHPFYWAPFILMSSAVTPTH